MLLPTDAWGQAIYVFILSIIRYVVFGGVAFLIFYVILKGSGRFKKIQQRWPAGKDYQREVFYSLVTFFIFALTPLVLNHPLIRPYTTIYSKMDAYPLWYFIVAFPLMLLIHDTYFYFTHRLMHHPRLFRIFHIVHHKSINPSPWAAFSFNPAEAFVESAIIYVFAFTIPIHFIHIFIFLVFMTIYNVYGHLGFELYPRGFNRHWIGRWVNTSVNHNMHHQYFKGNYGLYFTFWDRVMNTMNKEYDKRFDEVTIADKKVRTQEAIN